jgi:hypothetical protein
MYVVVSLEYLEKKKKKKFYQLMKSRGATIRIPVSFLISLFLVIPIHFPNGIPNLRTKWPLKPCFVVWFWVVLCILYLRFAKGSPHSVLLAFSQSYVQHDLK